MTIAANRLHFSMGISYYFDVRIFYKNTKVVTASNFKTRLY